MKILIFIFSLLLSMNLFAVESSPHGNIVMTMDNFHNDEGSVLVTLFSSSDGFPDRPKKAIKNLQAEIREGKLKVFFSNIPYGIYAVAVLHDENGNGEMDTNWVGMPKEGYGVSNDAKASFGPPKYKDAKFSLEAKELPLHIIIRY